MLSKFKMNEVNTNFRYLADVRNLKIGHWYHIGLSIWSSRGGPIEVQSSNVFRYNAFHEQFTTLSNLLCKCNNSEAVHIWPPISPQPLLFWWIWKNKDCVKIDGNHFMNLQLFSKINLSIVMDTFPFCKYQKRLFWHLLMLPMEKWRKTNLKNAKF